jgi:ABC-type antimicrobial peptide transport system permease subunit
MLMAAAAIALLMAVIGTYGLVAYGVSQRMHEIGVRIALGAGPADILRLLMRQGLMLTITGIAAGLVCAAVLTRGLEKLLFAVKPLDPMTMAVAPRRSPRGRAAGDVHSGSSCDAHRTGRGAGMGVECAGPN